MCTDNFLTLVATGGAAKTEALQLNLRSHGIAQLCRTGKVCIPGKERPLLTNMAARILSDCSPARHAQKCSSHLTIKCLISLLTSDSRLALSIRTGVPQAWQSASGCDGKSDQQLR